MTHNPSHDFIPGPDFAVDPGQAGQGLIKWAEQLHRKAQTYRGLQDEMSQLVVTETSADGMVRVSVDAQACPPSWFSPTGPAPETRPGCPRS